MGTKAPPELRSEGCSNPHLTSSVDEAHHCTVVFRIPGSRETAREFLTDLATQYPGCTPEIVAIQAGDALCPKEAGSNA